MADPLTADQARRVQALVDEGFARADAVEIVSVNDGEAGCLTS